MKIILATFLFAIFGVSSFYSSNTLYCETADLAILKIHPPEFSEEINGTVIKIELKNKGEEVSVPCILKFYDLDMGVQEALARNLDSITVQLIEENNGRAERYAQGANQYEQYVDEKQYDYDMYWEGFMKIPALKPGARYNITFRIQNHWIYDANCEIRAILDEEQVVDDCDRTNNQMDFFGWG